MKKSGLMKRGMITSTGSFKTKKTLKRINQLIKDIERNGCMEGIGNPEPLKGDLQGEFSRRIDEKNRLVYHMEDGRIFIAACRGHYSDK
mgnify:CR=1 FL=1